MSVNGRKPLVVLLAATLTTRAAADLVGSFDAQAEEIAMPFVAVPENAQPIAAPVNVLPIVLSSVIAPSSVFTSR